MPARDFQNPEKALRRTFLSDWAIVGDALGTSAAGSTAVRSLEVEERGAEDALTVLVALHPETLEPVETVRVAGCRAEVLESETFRAKDWSWTRGDKDMLANPSSVREQTRPLIT